MKKSNRRVKEVDKFYGEPHFKPLIDYWGVRTWLMKKLVH